MRSANETELKRVLWRALPFPKGELPHQVSETQGPDKLERTFPGTKLNLTRFSLHKPYRTLAEMEAVMRIKTVFLAATASLFIMGAAHAGGQGTSPGGMDKPSGAMDSSPGDAGSPESRNAVPAESGAPSGAPRSDDEGPDAKPAGASTENGPARDDRKTKQASPEEKDGKDTTKSGATENKARDSSESDRTTGRDATSKGEKGKSAKVDREQLDKARTYFRQNKPSVKAVERTEISVSIGLALPSSIVLYDVPPDVIVVSGGCAIKYFLWGDDIVLVDSCTREVIDII